MGIHNGRTLRKYLSVLHACVIPSIRKGHFIDGVSFVCHKVETKRYQPANAHERVKSTERDQSDAVCSLMACYTWHRCVLLFEGIRREFTMNECLKSRKRNQDITVAQQIDKNGM